MNNQYGIVPKVYDIDYSFIIKNYLNPEMWVKSWTLFSYKDFVVSLCIRNIYVFDGNISINFSISCCINDGDSIYDTSEIVGYSLSSSNIRILKKQINGAIRELLKTKEQKVIKNSVGYKKLSNMLKDEDDMLEEIANDFLDKEGVKNKAIREVYVESYVDNNSVRYKSLNDYQDLHKYITLPDYWLVTLKAMNDNTYDEVLNYISNHYVDNEKVNEILAQAKLIEDEDEDYIEDLRDRLEEI